MQPLSFLVKFNCLLCAFSLTSFPALLANKHRMSFPAKAVIPIKFNFICRSSIQTFQHRMLPTVRQLPEVFLSDLNLLLFWGRVISVWHLTPQTRLAGNEWVCGDWKSKQMTLSKWHVFHSENKKRKSFMSMSSEPENRCFMTQLHARLSPERDQIYELSGDRAWRDYNPHWMSRQGQDFSLNEEWSDLKASWRCVAAKQAVLWWSSRRRKFSSR